MSFLMGSLTVLVVLNCLLLILLVLKQLPKEAGLASGGAATATQALRGAGSGNVLTKATTYATLTFVVLALVITMLQSSFV